MKSFDVLATVEIPHGSMYKYEFDPKTNGLTIDRPLPVPLPYNYGFMPRTLHGDGDPLDICIIGNYPIQPLTSVTVKVLGVFICNDNGDSDDKIVAMVSNENISKLLQTHHIDSVRNYLGSYKEGFIVERFSDVEEAYQIIMKDLDAFQNDEGE